MTSSTPSNPADDGYRLATEKERHDWIRDGILDGYQIVIAPGGFLWIKKDTIE